MGPVAPILPLAFLWIMFTISCHVVKFTNIDTDFVLRLDHVPERPDVQRVLVMKFAHIDYID